MNIYSMRIKSFSGKHGGGVKRQHLLHYERSSQRETGYGYYLKDNETVLHGPFCYRRAGWLFFLPKTSIIGQYADNHKEGVWKFLKRYDGPDKRKARLTVTFHNGIHEGAYHLTVTTRSGVSWVTAQLKDDHATGLLSACIDGCPIQGQCDEEGRPDGVWTLTKKYSKTTARYYYEHWDHGQLTTSYYTLKPDSEEKKPCEKKIPHLVSSFINNEGAELEQRVPTGSHSWKGMER